MSYTTEFVSPKHPDKICDVIADAVLDAYLREDPTAKTAIEVMGGHGVLNISGEVRSEAELDISEIVDPIVGDDYKLNIIVEKQSPEIARGVDAGGAGDQGIMIGYATSATESFMPPEYELARGLCEKIYRRYPYDGKTQITIDDDGAVSAVVASFQNADSEDLHSLVEKEIRADEYLINPSGDWAIGGFDADSGLSGRKIVVDAYGPRVPVGGGAFSGKDATKVDRSGAYMARKIAVDYLSKFNADEVLVKLAYAIGVARPLMSTAFVDGRMVDVEGYDLTPQGIIKCLDLREPIYKDTAEWGHFGRDNRWDIPK